MLQARRKAEWERTAEILAMIYNVNRGPGQRALRGKDFLTLAPDP